MFSENQAGTPARVRRRAVRHAAPGSVAERPEEEAIDDTTPQGSINTRTEFGSVTVRDPAQVVKLGLVVDNHKLEHAWKMWPEIEEIARDQLQHLDFDPVNLFYSEKTPFPGHPMTTIERYYTPISNRLHTDRLEGKQ